MVFRLLSFLAALCLLLGIKSAQSVSTDEECSALVDEFLLRRFPNLAACSSQRDFAEYDPEDFVFFLHVPRTAGRSFWSCFLYRAFRTSKKCAKSYDSLRLELSVPDCKLIASHDDYSITDFMPDNFHVITQARETVDRVISSYEFTTLNIAQDYHPNITKRTYTPDKVQARDVWPWLYLIQLFQRHTDSALSYHYRQDQALKEGNPEEYEESLDKWVESISPKSGKTYYYHRRTRESKWTLSEEEEKELLPALDPYNNSLVLPLASFVESSMADELVNNAMTFQVLGLTNISYWEEAAEIRSCAPYSRQAQEKLLQAAKSQMDRMLHVSLTDRLDESLQSIAATLDLELNGAAWGGLPPTLRAKNNSATDLVLEDCRDELASLSDIELTKLLFKYRKQLDSSRSIARSRRHSQLSTSDFLPKWDSAIANLEYVREIQAEAMKRWKEQGEAFTGPHNATADDKQLKIPLWQSYVRCVNTSMDKSKNSKIRSMNSLALPDERRIFFTKEARKNIPQSTIDLIKEKNWMDVQLYEYAVDLYDAYLKYQKDNGLLKEIPDMKAEEEEVHPPDPPKPMMHVEL